MFTVKIEKTATCPSCFSSVRLDITKCPHCGMEFEEGDLQEVVASSPAEEAAELSGASEEGEDAANKSKTRNKLRNLLRDRILFYTGLILVMLGGPGLAFGSWLHDILNVPIVGEKYEVFGWINVMFAIVGLAMFIVGVVLLALSLRGGVVSKEELEKSKAEGSDA